ncbi:MAG TPA: TerC family protein [Candidatus Stackebrandtia faecavium]|nr:TerC family protein [Candidatus Stackebrandtia faecavium]
MTTPVWVWILTVSVVAVLLTIDLFIIGRRPHEPSTKEATSWVTFYIALAVLFGIGVWIFAGHTYGVQFFTGYITEYSMSIDNLFIFMLIMSSFSVPRKFQQKALMVGIMTALILRAIFIAIGAELVERFVWIFFIFGFFLIYTAIHMVFSKEDEEAPDNAIIRFAKRVVPVSDSYGKGTIFTKVNGKRMATPLLIVMIALGTTDLIFAVDSIPATFGITQEAFLVFTVNVFALMGLRQLYFLLGGMLKKLIYLTAGLAAILAFIGIKLVFHALAHNDVPFINGGEPVGWAPDIDEWTSLIVIVGILAVATLASLFVTKRREKKANAAGSVPEDKATDASESTDAVDDNDSDTTDTSVDKTQKDRARHNR